MNLFNYEKRCLRDKYPDRTWWDIDNVYHYAASVWNRPGISQRQ